MKTARPEKTTSGRFRGWSRRSGRSPGKVVSSIAAIDASQDGFACVARFPDFVKKN
jgi:hypothetical protein